MEIWFWLARRRQIRRSIFVYTKNGSNWTFVKRIANPSPISSGFFGGVISVYGNKFITSGTGNANQGRAYIYNWNGSDFDLEATLVSNDIAASDQFGSGVSMNANEAAVGAFWDDDKGNESGSVYMFKRNGSNWVQSQKIVASNGNANDNFGGAVALVNDKLIVTSSTDSEFASFGGSAYEFTYSNGSWNEDSNFSSTDANQNEGFGRVVASSGKTVAFAASGDDQRGTFAGAVFLLDLDAASTSEKIALANSVQVFPNPVVDILNVNLNSLKDFNSNDELNYRIVDTTGKIVLKGRLTSNFNQVNVSTIPGGNYILEMDWNGITFGKQFLK
ncbi:MAG: T9SS type A sorting domain-containing protein [Saprospiraceae bacterium]